MKQSQNLDRSIKKDRTVFTSSAQVYGRAPPEKATEIGRFKNAACTSVLIVADLFTAKHCIYGVAFSLGNLKGFNVPPFAPDKEPSP